ncbi:hypothetical protein GCM10010260_61040 [Streptomyces filipinensis]|uniref:Uncharacterized protein n=1 Tax=Streptomyces filipinensis TaxID=66887 RepID=A0A918IIE9_9ACTN|nr:hypothetical protein GCM10010260_61040 [Streptomyces filipinensis]
MGTWDKPVRDTAGQRVGHALRLTPGPGAILPLVSGVFGARCAADASAECDSYHGLISLPGL